MVIDWSLVVSVALGVFAGLVALVVISHLLEAASNAFQRRYKKRDD